MLFPIQNIEGIIFPYLISNRPWAVLQKPLSLINSFSQKLKRPFPPNLQNITNHNISYRR